MDTLFVLAQWWPGTGVPLSVCREWQQVWQIRLEDWNENIRRVAGYALLRRALEKNAGDGLRRVALEAWRIGTESAAVTHWLGLIASRFYEVRAQLAAGTVPDFRDELKLPAPAERQYPRLALPPGHITEREWKMKNGELKMENGAGWTS